MYRATEKATKKTWAAKFIKCTPAEKELIKREIKIMKMLHHPRLLQLYEIFEMEDEMVMIIEL